MKMGKMMNQTLKIAIKKKIPKKRRKNRKLKKRQIRRLNLIKKPNQNQKIKIKQNLNKILSINLKKKILS